MLGLSFHIISTTSYNNLPPYPARFVSVLLIGLKTIILTVLKSSLAHALNHETLPLIYDNEYETKENKN